MKAEGRDHDKTEHIASEAHAQLKAAFDKLAHDNADQKASFDNHMAKAELDASDQKASFDNQLAKAELDAGGMKVCTHSHKLLMLGSTEVLSKSTLLTLDYS